MAHSAHGHHGPERAIGGNAGARRRRKMGTGAEEGQKATEESGDNSPKGTRYEGRLRPAPRWRESGLFRGILLLFYPLEKRTKQKEIIFEITNSFFAGDLVETFACWSPGWKV